MSMPGLLELSPARLSAIEPLALATMFNEAADRDSAVPAVAGEA